MARPKKQRINYTTNDDVLSMSINVEEESVLFIKGRMKELNVSQATLTRELEISKSCIGKFFRHPRHHIRINSLRKILKYLDLDVILEHTYREEEIEDDEDDFDDDDSGWDFN